MKTPSVKDFLYIADVKSIAYPEFVEKDFFAIQLLKLVLELPIEGYDLQFAGGTCLSKAHVNTFRFSEDIDVKLKPTQDVLSRSGGEQKKLRKQIKLSIEKQIEESSFFETRSKSDIGDVYKSQIYYINYPRKLNLATSSIKPHLQLELTECPHAFPTVTSSVKSLYAEVADMPPEIEKCSCTNLLQIAAEKFVALLRRVAKHERSNNKEISDVFLIRHVYDLFLIQKQLDDDDSKKLKSIIKKIIEHDIDKYSNHEEFKNNAISELTFGYDQLVQNKTYSDQYARFLKPLVYADSPANWNEGLNSLESILESL